MQKKSLTRTGCYEHKKSNNHLLKTGVLSQCDICKKNQNEKNSQISRIKCIFRVFFKTTEWEQHITTKFHVKNKIKNVSYKIPISEEWLQTKPQV